MINDRIKGLGFKNKKMTAFVKLIWSSESIKAELVNTLHEHGITLSQFGILDALSRNSPLSQRELGNYILKSGGNITMVIDNLEKKDLVKRERNLEDRRFINVTITAKGKKKFKNAEPEYTRKIEGAMNRLTISELDMLETLCVKLGTG